MTLFDVDDFMDIRDGECRLCKMFDGADRVCQLGIGPKDADVMVVSKFANSKKWQEQLEVDLESVGLKPENIYFTQAVKCRSWDNDPSAADVKKCRPYLEQEINWIKPKFILAFGNEALLATTGHSGITNYRGKPIDKGTHVVVPTLAQAAVNRNPGQREGWLADLRLFAAQVSGKTQSLKVPTIRVASTKALLKELCDELDRAHTMAYDIETTGYDEYQPESKISTVAMTLVSNQGLTVWAVPLGHVQSPWRSKWKKVLRKLAPHMERVPKQIAQNGKFDARWLREYGVRVKVTFDTLLACHLLDENRQKGLKPQAAARLGVAPWGIDTRDLDSQSLKRVLKYNALDTFYTYHIYLLLREDLVKQPRLAKLFRHMLMPANELLIEAEKRGVWIDREKLSTNIKIGFDTRDDIEEKMMKFVPDPSSPGSSVYAESNSPWPTTAKGKLAEVNFNASNFARWFYFEHLGLPVIERTKTGQPSMAEACMLELKGEHPIIELHLERAKWQKYCSSFLTTYEEMADEHDRIHTTFKLYGTVTGRLSSGKADAEKITARTNIRGVNLQQVPRDTFIRGLFGAAPGYTFVEVDFSQVELRVVAFLSRDRTMLHLYQTGQDIHRATAAWVLGVPPDQVSKDDRKKAKAVNFGFVYGMGAPKFVSTAFEKYEVVFSLDEAKAIRRNFFEQFAGLPAWHAKQRRLVNKYARVVSPLGRVRHLPDIRSEEEGVRAEAERQAINSPVQSFASDMNLLAMIYANDNLKRQGVEAHPIGTVHDATLWEVRTEHLRLALPTIKRSFEQVPLNRFGVNLDIPIVADIKVGSHWGDARELTEEEVYDWKE